ncbi:MAG: ATP-binding cassette domain-containing protein [Bacteroidales bacterium]|nr:ATP-binding cassette domain-containing protein [Bacteroidales bacterium]MCF8404399.1 ATP-binding cassette domain-containing protein [Bacteroidales bacterium]
MEDEIIIKLEDVAVFQKEMLVLSKINLEICKGEFVYLIGKTGSGKSSLLQTLYADLPLQTGIGTVAGYDLHQLKTKEIPYLRRKIGIVFQDFQLLTDRSVAENLHFVMKSTGWKDKKKIKERTDQVLDRVGLQTKGFKMTHQLSGGEQQRVAIARALVNDPEIILADEPTGNLDPDTSYGIMNLLFEIRNAGRAVLMATHNYSLFGKYPARTLSCENGRIIQNN